MTDVKLQNLADTLTKSGLACSPNEALRMAQSIMGTETRVAQHFDEKNQKIDDSLTRKRTYQEEVDYLIEKTSMEKKDFHIPVKGYVREQADGMETEAAPKVEMRAAQVAQPEPIRREAPRVEVRPAEMKQEPPIRTPEATLMQKQELVQPDVTKSAIREPQPTLEAEQTEATQEIKPVHTDILDDERTLHEIMNEDAANVYTNEQEQKDDTPEYTVVNIQKDEFIGESIPQEPEAKEPDQPEQLFKEIKEEPKQNKEFKNPIDDVDLMDYFKF